MPTHKANRLRLLIALPLVAVLLVAFRSSSEPVENLVDKITLSDASDIESKAGEQGADYNATDAYKAFYSLNPDVKELSWRSNNRIVVKLKSGEEEVYTYGDKQSMAAAEKKYGKLPSSPPVVKRDAESAKKQQDGVRIIFPADIDYYQNQENLPDNYKSFLKKNPTVEKVGWKVKDSKGPEAVVIVLKSGKTETYNYNDKKGMAAAENKYGKLPGLFPPPPPVRAETPGTPPTPPVEPTPPTPPAPPAGENLPAPPPPLPEGTLIYKPAPSNQQEDHKAFLKRNPEINEIGWFAREENGRNLRLLILYLKGGRSEIIDLNNDGSIARAEKIYGKLPSLPAPPPPVRKTSPRQDQKDEARSTIFKKDANKQVRFNPFWNDDLKKNAPKDYKEFMRRNPTVTNVSWLLSGLPDYTSDNPEFNVVSIVISFKSGTIEAYDYNGKKRIHSAEKKYGALPKFPSPISASIAKYN